MAHGVVDRADDDLFDKVLSNPHRFLRNIFGRQFVKRDTAPPKKGTTPYFRRMYIMAKRLDGSRCHLVRR